MSYIRQLGHDSSTAWQGYKASNKWHRKKHHVRYVLPSKSMFAPDSDFLRVGYVPMNGWESRQMEEMSLPPQAAEVGTVSLAGGQQLYCRGGLWECLDNWELL
ncbi:hypothetical protein Pmar_PMAR001118 [Perkinsus marinus ATCC 50983]|uniref:Uncharacterized protein n=1 Tax=Perkinsus marinus (strain ATCC 50983 / TXsc) TaxID=423536 RepID=C5KSX1_PERM5|nr:hypothetical protein Pmar_PMAR001118 [Perkinsus marinus ATCC 50983]EER12321.1 hypothetical protein Pmar_PMAR001118 [Perkinsus marinus ATCC 50983]|eukprot:XP_002780526.1 hypothetical protein Pmar_PMAR001118 [Perkinsus marinus ATCC 50983]